MNNLVMSKQVGVVSLLAKKNKLKISKIENPHPGIQPLAEVERFHLQFKNILVVNREKLKSTRRGNNFSRSFRG